MLPFQRKEWWPGAEWIHWLRQLTLRAHFVRLSALRASVELPTRGFSVASWFAQGYIFQ